MKQTAYDCGNLDFSLQREWREAEPKCRPGPANPLAERPRQGRKIEPFSLHCVSVHANMPPCCHICSLSSRALGCLDFL